MEVTPLPRFVMRDVGSHSLAISSVLLACKAEITSSSNFALSASVKSAIIISPHSVDSCFCAASLRQAQSAKNLEARQEENLVLRNCLVPSPKLLAILRALSHFRGMAK